jgi:hypothetical protein
MKARAGVWLALLAASMLVMPGCEFIKEHEKAAIGVGAGALGGAAIGALAGGEDGAIVGAVVGALAGGAIGAYLDHRDKSAEETRRDQDYRPAQGVRLELTKTAADPKKVAPGQEVRLEATYAVMTPNPQQEIVVRETRVVTFNGQRVAQAAVEVNRIDGTYTSEVPIKLPAGSASGTYKVRTTVETHGDSSSRTTDFEVR